MQAVRIHTYGGPEVLTIEDVPCPKPQTGEVLIRVHAAGVNPVDSWVREGRLKELLHHSLPLTLGWDVSGAIEQVAADITQFKVGDAVYARPWTAQSGCYADYVAVPAAHVALKPTSLTHVKAAAVPLAALTAWHSLFDVANLQAGQRILIHGAAGGVGSFAVQFAKWKGAHVLGTASSRNVDLLHQLGVDWVINYQTTQFEEIARQVDVVLDTVGGETQVRSFAALREGGILVSIVSPPAEALAQTHRVRSQFIIAPPNGTQLKEIATLIDAGWVKPIVEAIVPLTEVRQAHEQIQTGHTRGKIVLQVV